MPKSLKNQSYASLKSTCLKQGTLFEDPEFPASSKSLFHSKVDSDIEWLRPKEICRVPKLVVEGLSADDIVYDDVSRSWFATACMSLTREPKLWNKVVPDSAKQEWDEKNPYAGIFKFSLWRFGEWVEVVVDDRLPVKGGKLVYCRSGAKNEFWSALLEKAYAKLFGDYESMAKGNAAEAVVDFTGGVMESLDLRSNAYSEPHMKASTFQKIREAFDNKGLINCEIKPQEPVLVGTNGPKGIIMGLGYNITMVKDLEFKSDIANKLGTNNLRLLRLFSPMGTGWEGPYSNGSPEMSKLQIQDWEKLGVKYEREAEFWMSFNDFNTIFTNIDICHFYTKSVLPIKKPLHETTIFSEWNNNARNGGADWRSDTVLRNPQFVLDIKQETDDVIVSLEQRDDKGEGTAKVDEFNCMGFFIMKVERNRKYRAHIKGEVEYQTDFDLKRSVFGQKTLPRGRYVILACCQNKAAQGRCMLRIFAGSNPSATELQADCPVGGCCKPTFKLVSTIEVLTADGLCLPETNRGTIDPFIVIRCEGEKVQSEYKKNTTSPKFNEKATFYRKNPSLPIIVEALSHKTVFDTFIGEAKIDAQAKDDDGEEGEEGGEEGQKLTVDLFGKKKETMNQKQGEITVFIRSSFDLALL